jgi:hypothetical protein
MLTDYMKLFLGRTDAWGTGRGEVIRGHVSADLFDDHLHGRGEGLGIFPLLDDATVNFSVIDLDEPDFESARSMQDLLPGTTWLERSRSGNAHVWAFFSEPCEAWVARGLMREATVAIDKPRVEVFPKQDRLMEGMVGNYINLPYFGGTRPMIDCASPEEFVSRAMAVRNDPESWRKRARFVGLEAPEERERTSEFGDQAQLHSCAEHIIANRFVNPIREGHRNTVYFNVAKQILNWREVDEDEAWNLLVELEGASPDRIPERELRRIFDNAKRGEWVSTGCDDPLMSPYILPDCPIVRYR